MYDIDYFINMINNFTLSGDDITLQELFQAIPDVRNSMLARLEAAADPEDISSLENGISLYDEVVTGGSKYSHLKAVSDLITVMADMQDVPYEIMNATKAFNDANAATKAAGKAVVAKARQSSKDGSLEYLVKGATLKCTYGSKTSELDLPKDHGVNMTGSSAINEKDSKGDDNIKDFGTCHAPSNMEKPCKPDIVGNWKNTYQKTKVGEKGSPSAAATMKSFLVCSKGGMIEPKKSGQSFTYSGSSDENKYSPSMPDFPYVVTDPPPEKEEEPEDEITTDENSKKDIETVFKKRVENMMVEDYKKDYALAIFPLVQKNEEETGVEARLLFSALCIETDYGQDSNYTSDQEEIDKYSNLLQEGNVDEKKVALYDDFAKIWRL